MVWESNREIKTLIGRGDTLAAYDLALQSLEARKATAGTEEYTELQYFSVLALVRSGATRFAEKRYQDLGLGAAKAGVPLAIDIASMLGRILKDRALAASGDKKKEYLERAIDAYQIAADKTNDLDPLITFPLINVAALCLWAGDGAGSRCAAERVLTCLDRVPEHKRDEWHIATAVEARLLVGGEANLAIATIEIATLAVKSVEERKWQDLAVTRNQLRRNCQAAGIDEAILSPLRAPPIIVYAGDRAGAGLDPAGTEILREDIRNALAENKAWSFFGGLRAGFEIELAEAVMGESAELNVVLPFPKDVFVDREVKPYGEEWVTRFRTCISKAKSVRVATDHGYGGETASRYARRLAMGYAILLARRIDSAAIMIVGLAQGGDCLDARTSWQETGRDIVDITLDGAAAAGGRDDENMVRTPPKGYIEHASLFGDFTGFSQLPEHLMPIYAKSVLGGVAKVLRGFRREVVARNSWGDAIVAHFRDARQAAKCAVELQAFLASKVLAPDIVMRMRIGLHYGPAQRVRDQVQRRIIFLGKHVVQAARIEPVAIPGMIYVSEPFAAALAVDKQDDYVCDYLGVLDTAKSFGKLSLYALRNARDGHVA